MSQGHPLDPTILRHYDIRGVVGRTLSTADARAIGRGFAAMVGERGGGPVCVGRDGRLSSPDLEAALVEGPVPAWFDQRSQLARPWSLPPWPLASIRDR